MKNTITSEVLNKFYQELKSDTLKQMGNLLDDFIVFHKFDILTMQDYLKKIAKNANTQFQDFVFEEISKLDAFTKNEDNYLEKRG